MSRHINLAEGLQCPEECLKTKPRHRHILLPDGLFLLACLCSSCSSYPCLPCMSKHPLALAPSPHDLTDRQHRASSIKRECHYYTNTCVFIQHTHPGGSLLSLMQSSKARRNSEGNSQKGERGGHCRTLCGTHTHKNPTPSSSLHSHTRLRPLT